MPELALKLIAENKAKTCGWRQIPEFGMLQGLPPKPINSYSPHDDGWEKVFKGVKGVVVRIRERKMF